MYLVSWGKKPIGLPKDDNILYLEGSVSSLSPLRFHFGLKIKFIRFDLKLVNPSCVAFYLSYYGPIYIGENKTGFWCPFWYTGHLYFLLF